MATVRIPESHFIKSAKRQYSDAEISIVREALQNSVDAGATQIQFIADDESVEIIDNGHGMDEQRMVEAMLTMSGTAKEAGAIGGFGAAKELLLFCHKSYRILSRDIHVDGHVLEYEMKKAEPIKGTSIKMWFHQDFLYKKERFMEKAKNYLASCYVKGVIKLNGEIQPTNRAVGTPVKGFAWGTIYSRKTKESMCYMSVRINGVMMFQRWVGSVHRDFILEITKPSIETLTMNRDGLQLDADRELQQTLSEITIDKESFGRLYKSTMLYRGQQDSYDDLIEKFLETEATLTQAEKFQVVEMVAAKAGISKEQLQEMPVEDVSKMLIDFSCKEQATRGDHKADFIIKVCDKGYDTIPEWLTPAKMGKQKRQLIKLWKHCLKIVFRANGHKKKFKVGWILDPNAKAMFSKDDNGIAFLLNPLHSWLDGTMQPKALFFSMLSLAAHEIAHTNHPYHDENFNDYSEQLMVKAILSVDSWWKHYTDASKEAI